MLGLIIFIIALIMGCGFWTSMILSLVPIIVAYTIVQVNHNHMNKVKPYDNHR